MYELQMVSERKVAVLLLLSLHPKQESWKRHNVGTDWGAAGREGGSALIKDVIPTHTATDHL